jgi:hypothetical protein
MTTQQWWRATPIAVASTPTALFREHAPPVFLEPQHWLTGCWSCAPRSPAQQQLLELTMKRRQQRAARDALRELFLGMGFFGQ